MSKSFLSEHTVEYALVNYVNSLLESKFSSITPLYFWRSREGGNLSRECSRSTEYFLIAVYARRPKFDVVHSNKMEVKFNSLIFEKAKYLEKLGILVFAGVPLVNNLLDFNVKCKFNLYCITGNYYSEDYKFSVTLNGNYIDDNKNGNKAIEDYDFIKIIKEKSKAYQWLELIDLIKGEPVTSKSRYYPFFGSYKPVYFLLKK